MDIGMDLLQAFEDGYKQAMSDIVQCKKCKHMKEDVLFKELWCQYPEMVRKVKADDFCSKGERSKP